MGIFVMGRKQHLALCLGVGLSVLAACDSPPSFEDAIAAAQDVAPVKANVRPGPSDASVSEAADLLRRVCVDTLPDFARAPQVLATLPVTQDSRSKLYYHNEFDLSFKLVPGVCSFVVAGADLGPKSVPKILATDPKGRIEFTRISELDGRNYLAFVVNAASGS